MPRRTGPSGVEFSKEFSLRIVSRTLLRYEESERVLHVEVEPGRGLAVYLSSAGHWQPPHSEEALTAEDWRRIGANIARGLGFLRVRHILC